MQEGRYIGHHGRTGALLAITPEGVKRGTGLRRLPAEERWTTDGWEELKGYPWDVQSRRRSEVPAVAGDEAAREISRDLVLAPPEMRKMYVLRTDVQHFGPTEGCPGCDAVVSTGHTVAGAGHNSHCRKRIEELLSRDASGQRRLERHRRRARGVAAETADETARADDGAEIPASEAAGEPVDGARAKRSRAAAEASAGGSALRAGVSTTTERDPGENPGGYLPRQARAREEPRCERQRSLRRWLRQAREAPRCRQHLQEQAREESR